MFLDLATQSPDLGVSLFHQSIQSFALLSKDSDLVLGLAVHTLGCCLVVIHSSLQLVILTAYNLELVLELAQSTSRETKILLDATHLFI